MSGLMVSWRDYADAADGASMSGNVSQDEAYMLNKALTIGSDVNNPGAAPGQGFPFRIESLEATLKSTTFRMEHIRLWRMLPKIPVFNTVHEFNRVTSFGDPNVAAFIDEIGRPEESDGTYERVTASVKFLGVTGRLSLASMFIRGAHGNMVALKTAEKTMDLLQKVETLLFDADSALDASQWDGLEKQIRVGAPATHIIDLRGAPLTEESLVDGGISIMDGPIYGIPTHLLLNPKNKSDLVKSIFPRARFDQFQKDSNGMIGANAGGIETTAGDIVFATDTFINDGGTVIAAGVGDVSKRPATPSVSAAITTPADPASKFAVTDVGTYSYYVAAANKFGISPPVTVAVSEAVAAGDKATWGITPGAGPTPSYYIVYRTRKNQTTDPRRIQRIPNAAALGATTFNDYNDDLPGTNKAYLVQGNQDNFAFGQLAPMVKIPLGTQETASAWMQLLMGMLLVYTPARNVIFKNVGRSVDFVGSP